MTGRIHTSEEAKEEIFYLLLISLKYAFTYMSLSLILVCNLPEESEYDIHFSDIHSLNI